MSISLSTFEGRLGNSIFQNVGMSILAKKYNYKVEKFKDLQQCKWLGFQEYSGTSSCYPQKLYTDKDLMSLLKNENNLEHGICYKGFFQVKEFLEKYDQEIKSLFSYSLNKKYMSDLFVHVRLTDAKQYCPPEQYFRSCIEQTEYVKGCISSDDLSHPLVQKLAVDYNLHIVNADPVNLIALARSYGSMVLSNGTFSWWIAYMSNAKQIFYPTPNLEFHPDIYPSNWTKYDT